MPAFPGVAKSVTPPLLLWHTIRSLPAPGRLDTYARNAYRMAEKIFERLAEQHALEGQGRSRRVRTASALLSHEIVVILDRFSQSQTMPWSPKACKGK